MIRVLFAKYARVIYICGLITKFMDTKLTLTLEKDVVEKAKVYAKTSGRSLSDLIENYLKLTISSFDKSEETELTPIVKSMIGTFKVPKDFDERKALLEGLSKKK